MQHFFHSHIPQMKFIVFFLKPYSSFPVSVRVTGEILYIYILHFICKVFSIIREKYLSSQLPGLAISGKCIFLSVWGSPCIMRPLPPAEYIPVVWLLSHIWLFCDPMDYNLPGFSVLGISQAGILEWIAISFSRESSQSRDRTHISCMADRFFTTEQPGKPTEYISDMDLIFLFASSLVPPGSCGQILLP